MAFKFAQISYEEFMTSFIRPATFDRVSNGPEPRYHGAFDDIPQSKVNDIKEDLYEPFVSCVEKAGICGDYKLALTHNTVDEGDPTKDRVNAGLFLKQNVPSDDQPHWASQVLWIEFKRQSPREKDEVDPFDSESEGPVGIWDIRPKLRKQGRAQLQSYIAKIFAHQQRLFMYSILILSASARIIRWDRAGAVVTEKFNYRDAPEKLGEFLYLFSRMADISQGYDPTASLVDKGSKEHKLMLRVAEGRVKKGDATMAQSYARDCFKRSLDPEWTWWKLSVIEDRTEGNRGRIQPFRVCGWATATRKWQFLVGKPIFQSSDIVGRGTRGYVAFDVSRHAFVFLKDQWRVEKASRRKEGDVIRALNEAGVNYIPTLVCHGDLRNRDGQRQHTRMQEFWNEEHSEDPLGTLFHYRLVEEEVACPLNGFQRGYDLVKVVSDCLQGHKEAVEKAGLLHRDISEGNLMYVPVEEDAHGEKAFRGMLCDWELAASLTQGSDLEDGISSSESIDDRSSVTEDSNDSMESNSRCMGTWQFMSIRLLSDPRRVAGVQDDLESFFHVILYEAIRYLRHTVKDVPDFMERYFNDAPIVRGEYSCGYLKSSTMKDGVISAEEGESIRFLGDNDDGTHPLNDVLTGLLRLFKAYYIVTSYRPGTPDPRSPSEVEDIFERDCVEHKKLQAMLEERMRPIAARLENHDAVLQVLGKHLSDADSWPRHDKTGDQRSENRERQKQSRRTSAKRGAAEMEDLDLPAPKRTKLREGQNQLATTSRHQQPVGSFETQSAEAGDLDYLDPKHSRLHSAIAPLKQHISPQQTNRSKDDATVQSGKGLRRSKREVKENRTRRT